MSLSKILFYHFYMYQMRFDEHNRQGFANAPEYE